jgi:hypothetical protein
MKEYNEYEDKLVSFDVAMKADIAGYTNRGNKYDVECFTCSDDTKAVFDSWTGLIADGEHFLAHRPTQTGLAKWLREIAGMVIFVKLNPHYGTSRDIGKKWWIDVNSLFIGDSDNYEDGFEVGLSYALDELVDQINT